MLPSKKKIAACILCITTIVCAQNNQQKNKVKLATMVPRAVAVTKGEAMEPNIDIGKDNREAVGKLLNTLLSDEYLLYTKTYNYHWNVTGMSFNDLHLFFGKQFEELEEFVDIVAERARAIGVRALGTMSEFLKQTRLQEQEGVPPAKEMIKNLLDDHEAIIRSLRVDLEAAADLGDMGTNNILNDLLCKHEKMAWMLRSYLQ